MEIYQIILVKTQFLSEVKIVMLSFHMELFLEQMKAEEALCLKLKEIGNHIILEIEEALLQRVLKLVDFPLLRHLETRLMYKLDFKVMKVKITSSF
jgi:hypothetical protein